MILYIDNARRRAPSLGGRVLGLFFGALFSLVIFWPLGVLLMFAWVALVYGLITESIQKAKAEQQKKARR